MKQYMVKDIRDVVIDSGPPINVFDMGDKRRAFQFYWGGGSYVVPQVATGSGSATTLGNTTWYSATALATGGGMVTSEGCLITYLTQWDESRQAWIVDEYRYPKQLFC